MPIDGKYITTVIPAHNEQDNIRSTIDSVINQVDRVIVACDNCTDDTYNIVKQYPKVTAFNTVNNSGRKAGALNQALLNYVDWSFPGQYIMVMDADTIINSDWVEQANKRLPPYRNYNAVGSVFESPKLQNPNVLEMCQDNEWIRYRGQIKRTRKVFVLTGTCSLIKASLLQKVYQKKHYFYDEGSITEDFCATLDLKEVGAKMISPLSCTCSTAVMKSYRDLYRQRRRWYLGALQQVTRRKLTKPLRVYVGQQLMLLLSVVAFLMFLIVSFYIYTHHLAEFNPAWLVIFFAFDIERVLTVWGGRDTPWKTRFFAASMLPELFYSFILQASYVGAVVQLLTGSKGTWDNHTES